MPERRVAHDGEEFAVRSNGGDWLVAWHSPVAVPAGAEPCGEAGFLGFGRAVCLTGPEEGLVLVRSVWRAEVELMSWEPRYEIAHRRVVPATELLAPLRMEGGFEPVYHRALAEAGLM